MRTTDQQLKIMDHVPQMGPGESLAVHARAGTGKTTTLALIAAANPKTTFRYYGFNRALITEAKNRFGRNVRPTTLHALAFHSLGLKGENIHQRYTPAEIVQILSLHAYGKEMDAALIARHIDTTLTNFCHSGTTAIHPDHTDLPGSTSAGLRDLVLIQTRRMWADIMNGLLPPTHDHYLKIFHIHLCLGLIGQPREDAILYDEAQDSNPVSTAIVRLAHHARHIWVGDPWQAIYGFRGAKNALEGFSGTVMELTVTHRFGQPIVDWANYVLAWHPTPPTTPITTTRIDGCVRFDDEPDPKSTLITRTRAGLFMAALRQSQAKKTMTIEGNINGHAALLRDLAALKLGRPQSIRTESLKRHRSWQELVTSAEYSASPDLKRASEVFSIIPPEHINDALRKISEGNKPAGEADLTLTTIHAMKGREADRISIGSDALSPGEATESHYDERPEEISEETNLLYVAMTRARDGLTLPTHFERPFRSPTTKIDMPPDVYQAAKTAINDAIKNQDQKNIREVLQEKGFCLLNRGPHLVLVDRSNRGIGIAELSLKPEILASKFPNHANSIP